MIDKYFSKNYFKENNLKILKISQNQSGVKYYNE